MRIGNWVSGRVLMLLSAAVLLSACLAPLGESNGNLVINFPGGGGGGARAFSPDSLAQMRYSLELSGPGGAHETRTIAPGVTSVTLSLNPGPWTIHAEALSATGNPCGAGQTSVTLEQGKTTPAHITMTRNTWFVAQGGSDTDTDGSETKPFATMDKALAEIGAAYDRPAWPGKGTAAAMAARILVGGSINTAGPNSDNALFDIKDSGLYQTIPPITLAGKTADDTANKLDGDATRRVLYISKADVTLGPGLTLMDGNVTSNSGGGVCVTDGGIFTMKGGAISGNKATSGTGGYGGGVYVANGNFTMKGGAISGNEASLNGGGVYVDTGNFTLDGGVIIANKAINSGVGGGVYVTGGNFTMKSGTIGGTTAAEANKASIGGGVGVGSGSSFTMEGGTIGGNEASNNGGGVYFEGTIFTMLGGAIGGTGTGEGNSAGVPGISSGSGGGVFFSDAGTFNMSGAATISGNSAVYYSSSGGEGGGVCFYSTGTFNMSGAAKISGNQVTGALAYGGGVYVINGDFDMSETAQISGNVSSKWGGGVYFSGSGTFTMSGGIIGGTGDEKNTADVYGGGVCFESSGGTFIMSGTAKISGNVADPNGGGVYFQGTTFTMLGGTISGNTAVGTTGGNGGGVYVYDGNFDMSGGTISGNEVTGTYASGGGVHVYNGNFDMSGTAQISGNKANGTNASGGGVYFGSSTGDFDMSGTAQISGNEATNYGGGVYFSSTTGTFSKTGNSIIYGNDGDSTDNTADTNGHAVYVSSSPPLLRNSTAGAGVNLDSTTGTAGSDPWE